MALDVRPGVAAVVRNIDAATRAAAQFGVGMHHNFPGARKHGSRILRIHGETRAACVFVDEQNPLPVLAAVGRAIDATLLLRTG